MIQTFEIFKINIIFTSLSIKIHCIVIYRDESWTAQ